MSGLTTHDANTFVPPLGSAAFEIAGRVEMTFNVIVGDSAVGQFARIDGGGFRLFPSGDCSYFGMIIPSS